jgi:DNA-binding IclR family transcriptional regulator
MGFTHPTGFNKFDFSTSFLLFYPQNLSSKDETMVTTDIALSPKTSRVPAVEQAVRVTLDDYGFVKKNPNRKGYVLGPGLLTITGKMLETLSLSHFVEPVLYELAKKAGATVTLGLTSDDKTYVVAEYEGAPGLGISSPIGHNTPITYGSHGKAIAASLPEEELEAQLQNKILYFYGTPEKYDENRLRQDLAQCRRTGFSLELGDIQTGVNAVAVAVTDHNSYPIGYVTIVGFFTKAEALKIGPLAVEAVKTISKEAGHMIFWQRPNNGRTPAKI